MKKNIIYLVACLSVLLSSCGDSNNDKPVTVTERTVLVYIAGDNNLGTQGFAAADIAEMVRGMETVDVDKNKLLVYYDDARNAQLLNITKDKSGKVIKEIVKEYNSPNSVGVTEMKEVFSTAFNNYQAESYGVVFWSHGEGWIPKLGTGTRWFGQDGNEHMNISEMSEVLASAPHFDFIFFDACFMQSIEVAYELKEYADYFVSSPTEIPGPGAPYQVVVPAMFKSSGAAVATAQAYFDYYNSIYTGEIPNDKWTGGVSVSVIISSQLDQFAEATAKILPKYITDKSTIDVSGILCYDKRSAYRYYYDLDGLIKKLTNENEDYDSWNQSFEKTLPYYKSTAKNYSQFASMFLMEGFRGVSTYVPRANATLLNQNYYSTLKWYKKAGWDKTGW